VAASENPALGSHFLAAVLKIFDGRLGAVILRAVMLRALLLSRMGLPMRAVCAVELSPIPAIDLSFQINQVVNHFVK
jgi:hypothetical protein